jgi:hypothetical protein
MNAPLSIILSIMIFSSCAPTIRPLPALRPGSERILDKNYQLGQKQATFVGQPIVKVKDYVIERYRTNKMRATEDFVMTAGNLTAKVSKGQEYPVRGEATLDDKNFIVVNIPGSSRSLGLGALVDAEGRIYHRLINVQCCYGLYIHRSA